MKKILNGEPVLALAALVSAALVALGVHADEGTVTWLISGAVPLVVGVIQRSRVSPSVKQVAQEVADEVKLETGSTETDASA